MNKRMIAIILAIVAGMYILTLSSNEILSILLAIPGLIIAIAVHEFAHAKTADLLGDKTPRNQGRVTLNPFKHVSLMGLVALFTVRIGWGKPVMINPNNFTKIKNKKIGEALVAIAGPITNLLFAFITTFIYGLLIKYNVSFGTGNISEIIQGMIIITISINLGLAIFNLLPIPPLDGFSVLALILPKGIKQEIERNPLIITGIFLVLIWSGILAKITIPVLTFLMEKMLHIVALILG